MNATLAPSAIGAEETRPNIFSSAMILHGKKLWNALRSPLTQAAWTLTENDSGTRSRGKTAFLQSCETVSPNNEASTGLRPWYPSFLQRNPPKHLPCLLRRSGRFGCEGWALFELRPSPTVVGYGRRRSEGPPFAFVHRLTPWSSAQADKFYLGALNFYPLSG